jgi:hypothetical protein
LSPWPGGKEIKAFLRRLLRAIRAHWPKNARANDDTFNVHEIGHACIALELRLSAEASDGHDGPISGLDPAPMCRTVGNLL